MIEHVTGDQCGSTNSEPGAHDRVALNKLDLAVQLLSHSTDRVDKLQLFNRRIK